MSLNLTPLHDEFGATVHGLDVSRDLSPDRFAEIDAALNDYCVLVFPGQSLDDAGQIAFSQRFGELEEEHTAYYSHGRITYIGTVGNVDEHGNKAPAAHRGVHSQTGNEMWHSDSSFRENPSLHSLLYACEVPPEGGDTAFVSARSAYDRLDSATRSTIGSLIGVHDYIYSRTKVSEDAVTSGQRTYMGPVRQRLVRTNPVNGRKNLYLGSHLKEIEGMDPNESTELIAWLMQETTREESVYRHRWQAGDFLIWDNRCVLHRGCGYDADRYRRRLIQTRVRGTGPTLAECMDD